MNREQLEKVWPLPAILLLFCALDTWLGGQGASPVFSVKLLHMHHIPGAYPGILICAPMLTLLCLVYVLSQRRDGTISKWTEVPSVGIGGFDFSKTEIKVFFSIQLIIFVLSIVPSLVHIHLITDEDQIKQLIQEASSVGKLQSVQVMAADKLLKYDDEKYPSDGCAITLSVLLQDAGIDVPDTFTAIELGRVLRDREWQTIPLGRQKAGDVGSTCDSTWRHGLDHVYLVLQKLNDNEMIVADNQAPNPHFRYVSGHGDTATRFFLRASKWWHIINIKVDCLHVIFCLKYRL